MTLSTISRLIDTALDRTVAPGFSGVGYAVRRALPTWPADPEPGSLLGKTAVVTGASSGLGIETAAGLGRLGATVHLVVRNTAKGEEVAERLRREVGANAGFTVWRCDVSDLTDVRRFTAEFVAREPALDILVHNAGALPPTREESAQGHEMTMALHVLGPILMTEGLLPSLTGRSARVLFITSGGMYAQALRADDPEYRDGAYSGATAYARSKRAQIELLPVLMARWHDAGLALFATHPGWADTPGVSGSLPAFRAVTGPFLRDLKGGADTTVWLSAVTPAPASGGLWHDRRERSTHMSRRTRTGEAERRQMWDWVARAADLAHPAA
jgi:NAD(P)-dependent dehydrogenase (short-subunit alcohol dehydrogenase family)